MAEASEEAAMTELVRLSEEMGLYDDDPAATYYRECCGRPWKVGYPGELRFERCVNGGCIEEFCPCGAHLGGWGWAGCSCGR